MITNDGFYTAVCSLTQQTLGSTIRWQKFVRKVTTWRYKKLNISCSYRHFRNNLVKFEIRSRAEVHTTGQIQENWNENQGLQTFNSRKCNAVISQILHVFIIMVLFNLISKPYFFSSIDAVWGIWRSSAASFSSVFSPPSPTSIRYASPVTDHVSLQSKYLYKNIARTSRAAK